MAQVLRYLLLSWYLQAITLASPNTFNRRTDVCQTGIYGELSPILQNYPVAISFCQAIYPIKCSKVKRALTSTTTTKTTTTVKTTTTAKPTSTVSPQESAWSKCKSQPSNVVSTMCSCIQPAPKCTATTTTSTKSTTTTTTTSKKVTPTTTTTSTTTTSSKTTTTTTPKSTTTTTSTTSSTSTTTTSTRTTTTTPTTSTTSTTSTTTTSTTTTSTTTTSTTTTSTTSTTSTTTTITAPPITTTTTSMIAATTTTTTTTTAPVSLRVQCDPNIGCSQDCYCDPDVDHKNYYCTGGNGSNSFCLSDADCPSDEFCDPAVADEPDTGGCVNSQNGDGTYCLPAPAPVARRRVLERGQMDYSGSTRMHKRKLRFVGE